MQELINRAKELLADGTVARVLGWKAGDLPYNPEPAYFETCLLYTSPSPRDRTRSRMPSSA